MPRIPRRFRPDTLVEILLSTFQKRFFFIPSRRRNDVVVGCLAYASERCGARVCWTTWLSNHSTLAITPDRDADECAERTAPSLWLVGVFERFLYRGA